jgi:hypothetical protein
MASPLLVRRVVCGTRVSDIAQDTANAPDQASSTCRLPATQCCVTCGDIWNGTRLVILALTWQSRDGTPQQFWKLRRLAGERGSSVFKVLRYKPEGRWFDPRWCHGIFHWHKSFCSQYGPGVDSASNRNKSQDYFLGVNATGAKGWQPYQHPMPLSRNLENLTS